GAPTFGLRAAGPLESLKSARSHCLWLTFERSTFVLAHLGSGGFWRGRPSKLDEIQEIGWAPVLRAMTEVGLLVDPSLPARDAHDRKLSSALLDQPTGQRGDTAFPFDHGEHDLSRLQSTMPPGCGPGGEQELAEHVDA